MISPQIGDICHQINEGSFELWMETILLLMIFASLRSGFESRLDLSISRGGLPCKKDRGARRTFKGLNKRFWYLLGCSASKGPQREL